MTLEALTEQLFLDIAHVLVRYGFFALLLAVATTLILSTSGRPNWQSVGAFLAPAAIISSYALYRLFVFFNVVVFAPCVALLNQGQGYSACFKQASISVSAIRSPSITSALTALFLASILATCILLFKRVRNALNTNGVAMFALSIVALTYIYTFVLVKRLAGLIRVDGVPQ